MCSGPKSAWKALYRRVSSIVKYTGGDLDAAVGVDCESLDLDFLFGDLLWSEGYGKGVCSLGA